MPTGQRRDFLITVQYEATAPGSILNSCWAHQHESTFANAVSSAGAPDSCRSCRSGAADRQRRPRSVLRCDQSPLRLTSFATTSISRQGDLYQRSPHITQPRPRRISQCRMGAMKLTALDSCSCRHARAERSRRKSKTSELASGANAGPDSRRLRASAAFGSLVAAMASCRCQGVDSMAGAHRNVDETAQQPGATT